MYHGKLGLPFLISMMWLLTYGGRLERETFADDTADYLFFILFGAPCLLAGVALALFLLQRLISVGPSVWRSLHSGLPHGTQDSRQVADPVHHLLLVSSLPPFRSEWR